MAVPRHRIDGERAAQEPTAGWQSLYEIEDQGAVEAFVTRYPRLDALLCRVPGEVRARFNSDARLHLSVSHEPDSDSDEPDEWLSIAISTDRDWQDARDRLRRFDDEWWLAAMPRGEPLIAILPRFR